jgi:hypothetical protein
MKKLLSVISIVFFVMFLYACGKRQCDCKNLKTDAKKDSCIKANESEIFTEEIMYYIILS